MKDLHIGTWTRVSGPAVVGTAASAETLADCLDSQSGDCDIVEVRLDQMIEEGAGWVRSCRKLHAKDVPLILTLRHESERGDWAGTNAQRLDVLEQAASWIGAVDVEIEQNAVQGAVDRLGGLTVIGSFHDFEAAPDDARLDELIGKGMEAGADIVKIAVWIEEEETLARMERLLSRHPDVPLAVVGMGPLGPTSRTRLPQAGSCLTYGFLDHSVAPGQVSARDLKQALDQGGRQNAER